MAKPDILAHGNRLVDFEEPAQWLRELADKVEKGEVLSVFAVEIQAAPQFEVNKRWDWNYFKGRGVSKLEMQGAIFQALQGLVSNDEA